MNSTPERLMHAAWRQDQLIVPVPWNRAESVHTYIRRHGVGSTLCLDALAREAHLELHTSAGVEAVQALLDRWEA